jgi:hypothetical protein
MNECVRFVGGKLLLPVLFKLNSPSRLVFQTARFGPAKSDTWSQSGANEVMSVSGQRIDRTGARISSRV